MVDRRVEEEMVLSEGSKFSMVEARLVVEGRSSVREMVPESDTSTSASRKEDTRNADAGAIKTNSGETSPTRPNDAYLHRSLRRPRNSGPRAGRPAIPS